jgi:hypothetical protein
MGCSGVLFHPRSTVAAGVGAGLLRSQRSAPPSDAGLAGEASRRRGPGGDIGGPDSLGFVAAGRPELGAGRCGFGRAHLGSPDDRLETSVVWARGRVGGGERRGRRRSALYDPERTLATASSEPRREGRRGGAALKANFAIALCNKDDGATLDELHEAVSTLEDTERIARRVLGGAHPDTKNMEAGLRDARAALRARETPPA